MDFWATNWAGLDGREGTESAPWGHQDRRVSEGTRMWHSGGKTCAGPSQLTQLLLEPHRSLAWFWDSSTLLYA